MSQSSLQAAEPTEEGSAASPLSPEDAAVKGRLVECLETVLNKAQEPPKSKKVQHSNAKNAILFETISLIIHYDRCCGRGVGRRGHRPEEGRLGLRDRRAWRWMQNRCMSCRFNPAC